MNAEMNSCEQFKKDFEEFPFSETDDVSWLINMNHRICHISNLRRLIGKYHQILTLTPTIYVFFLKQFLSIPTKPVRNIFWTEAVARLRMTNELSLKGIWEKHYLEKIQAPEEETKKNSTYYKNLFKKIILLFQVIIIASLSLIAALISPLIFLAGLVHFIFSDRTDAMGFYSSILSNKTLYLVNKSSNYDYYHPIISHEHIHMIQDEMYKSGFIQPLIFHKTNVINDICYTEKLNKVSKICTLDYLFSPLEIEARLHEVVLTYYREKKIMPKNADEFIELILSFRFLAHSTEDNYENLLETRYRIGADNYFNLTFILLKTEHAATFFRDVLPIFYRRLLTYYGATSLIEEFDKSPPDRTLFDKLFIYI